MELSKLIYKEYYDNHNLYVDLCNDKSFIRSMYLDEVKWKVKIITDLINKQTKIDNVLDIGCATGDFLNEFPYGKHKTGIDICYKNIQFAKQKYPNNSFICEDFLDYSFNKNYDIIIISEILEHVENDKQLLEIALNNGKLVALNVPLEEELKKKSKYGINIHSDGHLRGYTRESINNLIKDLNANIKSKKIISIKNTKMFYKQRFQKYLRAKNIKDMVNVTKSFFKKFPKNYILIVERKRS